MNAVLVAFTTAVLATIGPALQAQPMSADRAAHSGPRTTFPGLKTIYTAAGVFDSGGANLAGTATSVLCTNRSSAAATVRVRFFDNGGALAGTATQPVASHATWTVSTHGTAFIETFLTGGAIRQGSLIVTSTESNVFCSAMIVNAADPASGVALHMVRYRPQPGTVE